MKKYGILAITLILTFALSACGRSNAQNTTATSGATSRATTTPGTVDTLPIIDPTMDTNIPDPTVNSNSTDGITDNTIGGTTDNTTPGARNGIFYSE